MPSAALKPCLIAALRFHEIGTKSPYRLDFASKGNSGATFGFMQGDLAVHDPEVNETFRKILTATDGFTPAEINTLIGELSVHLVADPLSAAELAKVNAALNAHQDLVNEMDQYLLTKVYTALDACFAAAGPSGTTIDDAAALMMAMWINMSGYPTKLLSWLKGGDPFPGASVLAAAPEVSGDKMKRYLQATAYYIANPQNLPHMEAAVAIGLAAKSSQSAAA